MIGKRLTCGMVALLMLFTLIGCGRKTEEKAVSAAPEVEQSETKAPEVKQPNAEQPEISETMETAKLPLFPESIDNGKAEPSQPTESPDESQPAGDMTSSSRKPGRTGTLPFIPLLPHIEFPSDPSVDPVDPPENPTVDPLPDGPIELDELDI